MKKLLLLLSLVFFSFAGTVNADPINLDVVDENFNSTEKIVIDQEEIRKSRASSLINLLETKANISVVSLNTQPNSIFIRGGDSSHVLILVDGVPMYDSSSAQRTMNLFTFNLNNVRRIEILKGSQSVMYGGQALSGVIKISTIDENNLQNGNTVTLEAGAAREKVNRGAVYLDTLNQITENIHFIGNAYGVDERTFSPVKGSEELYPKRNYGAELGVYLKGDWSNLVKVNASKDETDINAANYMTQLPLDTKNFEFNTELMGVSWVSKYKEVGTLTATYQKSKRTMFQPQADIPVTPPIPPATSNEDRTYEGDLIDVRADYSLVKNNLFSVNVGAQFTNEKMKNKMLDTTSYLVTSDTQQREGVYIKTGVNLSEYTLFEAGYRYETEHLDRLADSYHVGLTKSFENSTVKAEYSTGFKTPSLFQRYAADYGNPDLKSESAQNVSLSFDHKFNERFFGSLAVFSSYYDDLISYVPGGSPGAGSYQNVSKSRTSGIELASQIGVYEDILKLNVALGYQEPRDIKNNVWLARRPLHSGSVRLTAKVNDANTVGVEGLHVGSKLDLGNRLESYTLMNVFYNFTLNSWNSYFARIDNVTAKEYENSYGYITKGWAARVGTEIKF